LVVAWRSDRNNGGTSLVLLGCVTTKCLCPAPRLVAEVQKGFLNIRSDNPPGSSKDCNNVCG
jgi:hypothetical protein